MRYSEYQINILNTAFFYIIFNLLIVPGLAVPTGSTIFNLFKSRMVHFRYLLQNFYNLKNGDFFIILFLQQIAFNMFGSFIQLRVLRKFYFSPTAYLLAKNKKSQERVFFKNTTILYDIGYNYSINLVILGITFIYSLVK